VEITICSDWTAMRSRSVVPSVQRLVAPIALRVEGGVRPQAAFDATAKGARSWSPPIT
jgi:hypothetical protein